MCVLNINKSVNYRYVSTVYLFYLIKIISILPRYARNDKTTAMTWIPSQRLRMIGETRNDRKKGTTARDCPYIGLLLTDIASFDKIFYNLSIYSLVNIWE